MKFIILVTVFIFIVYVSECYRPKESFIVSGNLVPRIIKGPVDIKRSANVPLAALRSPLARILKPHTLPSFFVYKTDILVDIPVDQGNCGCCWAFVTCNILADRLSILTNGDARNSLSVQQLLSCMKNIPGCDVDNSNDCNGCFGGNPESAFEWLVKESYFLTPIIEGGLEYSQSRSNEIITMCPLIESSNGVSVKENSIFSLTTFIEETDYDRQILSENIENMKSELIMGGPFYCAMSLYADFHQHTGDRVYVSNKEDIQGGHAVEVFGFCEPGIDTRPGFEQGYWICRNSWTTNWPIDSKDGGVFAILMGSNECGIESRCGIATPLWKGNINGMFASNKQTTSFHDFSVFNRQRIGEFSTRH